MPRLRSLAAGAAPNEVQIGLQDTPAFPSDLFLACLHTWQRTHGEMDRLEKEFNALKDALNKDDRAKEWLLEYAKGWPPGSGPPAEVERVQREIDRDLEYHSDFRLPVLEWYLPLL